MHSPFSFLNYNKNMFCYRSLGTPIDTEAGAETFPSLVCTG